MERDRSCQTGPGASATEEPEAAEDVLELSVPSPGDAADSPGSAARPLMDPRRESALKFLDEVLSRRTRQAEEEARQLRADEARLIKAVVPRLTGLSLIPDPREARIVVRHRLHEFLSTVPLPPNATPAQRRALHREALTMLLRLGPRDDTERMLVMQMIAAHMASLSCFARAAAPDTPDAAAALHRAQAQKMSRVFLDLERTLRRRGAAIGAPEMAEMVDPEAFADTLLGLLRSEGFHIDDDGTLSYGHGHAGQPPVRREDPARDAVPGARGPGQAALPDARRRAGVRRPAGQPQRAQDRASHRQSQGDAPDGAADRPAGPGGSGRHRGRLLIDRPCATRHERRA